jgi:dienelactone hydrolase
MSVVRKFIQNLKPYATGLFPDPPTEPEYPNEKYEYYTQAWGSHAQGTYVMAYIPKRQIPDTPKAIIYLHGFAFGNPYYYDAHMQHLAKQGYYVFFADYQKDTYTDSQTPQAPTYDNPIKLLQAAIDSFQTSGKDMITTANESVCKAIQEILPGKDTFDIFLFGHSIGGLFALSWPYFVGECEIKAIIAADPLPSTAQLPSWIQKLIPLGDLPFLTHPVAIQETGVALANIPIAILIGDSDLFVTPSTWEQIWNYIKAPQKKIYISQSDYYYNIYRCDAQSALIAYHNQAVTNSLLVDMPQDIQLAIGGAGKQDNMRWRFVWDAFDRVLGGTSTDRLTFNMDSWSNGKPVKVVISWPH